MANPNFTGEYSTNQIYRDQQYDRCLTDDLDTMDTEIQNLSLNKAEGNHTHTPAAIGAAAANHTHDYAAGDHQHTEYAETDHTHSEYAAAAHEHSGYAGAAHTHGQADIEGLISALAAKAAATHDHTLAQIVGLAAALAAKADLVDGKVPAAQLPSYVSDIVNGTLVNDTTFNNASGTAVTPEADKLYNDTTTNKSYRWSGTEFVALNDGVALGETAATAYRGDRGKTAYEHSQDGTVHVTAAQKTAWDGKAAGNHSHTPASIGAAAASHTHDYAAPGHNHDAAYIAKALQMTADNGNVEFSFGSNSGKNILTEIDGWGIGFHTAYAIGGTEGNPNTSDSFRYMVHKTSARIGWVLAFGGAGTVFVNYDHNGTFRGWRQLYSTANPPTAAEVGAISKSLQFTSDTGDVKENLTGQDVLAKIKAKGIGFYTFYSASGTTNNPQASYGYRYLVHKTDVNHGWVLAFGSDGSTFTNYLSDGTWLGWKTLHDVTPTALWTGAKLMKADQTVTPSKPLSKCQHGWMLEWSDFDSSDNTANNYNIVHTPIFKRNVAGAWSGQNMMVAVPNYISEDGVTQSYALKQFAVHDNKLVGHATGNSNTNNLDVVLRAVYEF